MNTGRRDRRVRRRAWALGLARSYVRHRLRRAFDGLWIDGIEETRRIAETGPMVIAANHVAWWDAFAIVAIDRALGTESYVLMDADNLRRWPFFGAIGAIPLDRSSTRASVRDLRRGVSLLDRPRRALWIFPAGEQRPAHIRPLGFRPGIEAIRRMSDAPILPLSIDYRFGEQPKPRAMASFGGPIHGANGGGGPVVPACEREVIAGLERIDRFMLAGEGAFVDVLNARRRRSSGVPLAGRLLAGAMRGGHGGGHA